MTFGFKLDFARWTAALAAFAWLTAFAAAADDAKKPAEPPLPAFRQLSPMSGVVAAAKAAGLSLEGLAMPADRPAMKPGDTVTFLASLTNGKKLTQWIVVLKAAAPTEKEKGAGGVEHVLYSNTGHTFHFSENKAVVNISVLGPFKSPGQSKAETKQKRVVVTEEFLAMGLNGFSAFSLKMKAAQSLPAAKGKTVNVNLRPEPFPEDQVGANRQMAALFGITENDERALAGTVPALSQFFGLIIATPGLSDMLKSVIDLPMWSIISRGGKSTANLNTIPFDKEISLDAWRLPFATKGYSLPLELKINGKSSLLCQLAVMEPVPPFQTGAGVIALAAGSPDGKGPVLTLQLVAAQTADEKYVPAGP